MFDEINKEKIVADLQSLGLNEKEATIYLVLLKLGKVGSSKLIKETGLHGQYVYNALGSLEQKSLVQHVIMRGRKKFSAKNPEILTQLADHQKKVAQSLTSELNKIIVLPPQQEYEVYQGEESYIAHEFQLLEGADNGSELLVVGGDGDDFINTMGDEMGRYEWIREKKKITIRYIGSESQKEQLRKTKANRQYFDFRILPGLFTGKVNTNIWQKAIGFNIFGQPVTSFVVWNPLISESYRQFFETLWNLAKEKSITVSIKK